MRNLTIEKTREYVWRVNVRFGHADHNFITCWHVVDADSGERLIGGHSRGCNNLSGHPFVRRRKDAQAFILGYQAAEAGRDGIIPNAMGVRVTRKLFSESGLDWDGAEADRFREGAWLYFQDARRAQGRKAS